jgi:hypothetical protein
MTGTTKLAIEFSPGVLGPPLSFDEESLLVLERIKPGGLWVSPCDENDEENREPMKLER